MEEEKEEVLEEKPKPKPVAKKEKPVEKTVKEQDTVAIKLISGLTYKTGGLLFTAEHPYHVVTEDVAKQLLTSSKFREATPSEIKQYYGV